MNQNDATNKNAAQVGEREIVITRVFDAPRDLVFDAWTKEEHLSKWWGPQGFTTTIQKFEMKPGGTWQFIMYSPDGMTKLTYKTIFEETDAVFAKVKTYAVPGAEQTMDRLEEHLTSMTEKKRPSTE